MAKSVSRIHSGKIGEWQLAEQMLARGARPPIVTASLELPKEQVRDLYHSIHGVRPPNGLLPNNSISLLKTFRHILQANIFFLAYLRRGGDAIYRTANTSTIIDSYDSFTRLVEDAQESLEIDFTTAWYIARDLRTKTLEYRTCRKCRVSYLYSVELTGTHSCPYCALAEHPRRAARVPRSEAVLQ